MVVPTVEPSDETLAARAAAGDDRAFETIVERYQGRVYRLACRGESQFGTWLYRIATNAALMLRRARTRRPAESLEAFLPRFDAQGVHLATPAELQVAARADELLDRQVLAEKARGVIARLPDIYRHAFVLRDLEEMSTACCGGT
jgi:RNA polymerase sigma-70 factor (ECF subfamily)